MRTGRLVGLCLAGLLATGLTTPRSHAQTEFGVASWYGAERQGRLTASGEPFDWPKLTAAHPSLPFHTRARVTNLANGRSVEVVINDRGPGAFGRAIDLSERAAILLGMRRAGLARVKIEPLSAPSRVALR